MRRFPTGTRPHSTNASYNENLHLTSLWFFYASLVSLYTGSFESTVENHLNSIKELTSLEEYKRFILSRVEERLTNDYFDITLIGSEGLAVSGRGNNAWNAFVAALNILNAKILFSKSNLLVSKLFEPGTDGKRKSLEKHHLFPKAYLKTLGYNDAKINQMANYAFIDWKDNMEILDEAPSIYYPVVCEGRSPEEIQRMEEENALPHGDRYFLNACFIFDYLQCISRSAFLRRRYSHAERRRGTIHYNPLLREVLLPKGDY